MSAAKKRPQAILEHLLSDSENITKLLRFYEKLDKLLCAINPNLYRWVTWDAINAKTKRGEYFVERGIYNPYDTPFRARFRYRGIDWDKLLVDVTEFMAQSMGVFEGNFELPPTIAREFDSERARIDFAIEVSLMECKIEALEARNSLTKVQSKWRKEPFADRRYVPITDYIVSTEVTRPLDRDAVAEQCRASMRDGFYGPALNCDDMELTEEWMLRFSSADCGGVKATEDEVTKTMISYCMDILLTRVQDKVCNETGVLSREPLRQGEDFETRPVWGIDCYTRRMIELSIEDAYKAEKRESKFKLERVHEFVRRKLLPAINAQEARYAHNMDYALIAITKDEKNSIADRYFAQVVLEAKASLGPDTFKVHPKGTGVVCCNPNGVPAHSLVAEYLGELYPPHRWCEKIAVTKKAQNKFGLKPTLPDFYNILMERHRLDPDGYGILFVDASRYANMASTCSHSCESNCTSSIVVRNGKNSIAMTTNRFVECGEELAMDYYSVTSSESEWRAAVCLCGAPNCREAFLHFAAQGDLQQVLNRFCSPVYRFASLACACSDVPISAEHAEAFKRHGISKFALGQEGIEWLRKYAYELLKFIEYERRSLPSALFRRHLKNSDGNTDYTFTDADDDARSVMESRIQAMVITFSVVSRLLRSQPENLIAQRPVSRYDEAEAVKIVWSLMETVPELLSKYLAEKNKRAAPTVLKSVDDIRKVLRKIPKSYANLSEGILQIRKCIQGIISLQHAYARVQQLSDLLVLWAHTANFLYPQAYEAVDCDPINVYARDLGNNIPKSIRDPSKASHKKGAVAKKGSKAESSSYESRSSPQSSPNFKACDAVDKSSNDSKVETVSSLSCGEVSEDRFVLDAPKSESPDRTSTSMDCDPQEASKVVTEAVADKLKDRAPNSYYLDPDDVVYTGSETFNPMFIFWQLMGWYDAGSDNPIQAPEVFGTLQLPLPAQCFGVADVPYGEKERSMFIEHVTDVFKQSTPWPAHIMYTFTAMSTETTESHKRLFGSPFLDILLGVGSITKTLQKFFPSSTAVNKPTEPLQKLQFDDLLPPETTHCTWIQCSKCSKWRRVAWFIDPGALPQDWECSHNSWDKVMASCRVASDYDPELEDSGTTELSQIDDIWRYLEQQPDTSIQDCPVGATKDVFCIVNKVWYKAKIIGHLPLDKEAGAEPMVRVHFLGWQSKFDENISVYAGRIQPVGTYSDEKVKVIDNKPKDRALKQPGKPSSGKSGSVVSQSKNVKNTVGNKTVTAEKKTKAGAAKELDTSQATDKKRKPVKRSVDEWMPTVPQKKNRTETSRYRRDYDEDAILEAVLRASELEMQRQPHALDHEEQGKGEGEGTANVDISSHLCESNSKEAEPANLAIDDADASAI